MNNKLILSEEKLQAYWAWGHPKTSIILSLFTTLDQKKNVHNYNCGYNVKFWILCNCM